MSRSLCPVEEQEDEEVVDDEEDEEEAVIQKTLPYIPKPSLQEIQDHLRNHLPFRSWCPHCISGRGAALPHLTRKHDTPTVPTLHLDYAFLSGEEGRADESPVIVCRAKPCGSLFARLVQSKGTAHSYSTLCVKDMFEAVGYKQFLIKTDGEESLKALVHAAANSCDQSYTITFEHSPPNESQSNGVAERAVKEVQGLTRTLISSLAARVGQPIPDTHHSIPWLIRHAAFLARTCLKQKGSGLTSWQIHRGRPFSGVILEPFSPTLYKMQYTAGKLIPRWRDALYVGNSEINGSHLVYDPALRIIVQSRSIKPKPSHPQEPWSAQHIAQFLAFKALPWA